MQIFKVSMMVCACSLAAIFTVHAQDNAAQAAARQALAAKLFEMDAGNPSPTNPPAPAPAPAPTTTPAPVVKSPIDDMPPATTVPPTAPADNGSTGSTAKADAKAQAAAAKQAAEIKAKEDAAAKAQAKEDAKAKKLAEKEAAKKHDAEVADAEKQAKLNTDAAIKPPQPAAIVMPDMTAPPAPVSAAKQQQLAALLSKYQADQITPDEYQKQRADIMAQP